MNINGINDLVPLPEGRPAKARRSTPLEDGVQWGHSDKLERALGQATDTRPDEVKRAQGVLLDGSYPPDETIQKIADLMAMHLKKTGDSRI